MMTIILFVFFVYIFATSKYKNPFKKELLHDDNLSMEASSCLNGIFVALVFLSHFHWDVINFDKIDIIYLKFQWICGQLIVCSFLFFSGFGIYGGLKKDREGYTNKLVKSKLPQLVLRFDFCVLLYAIVQLLMGNSVSIKDFVLSLLTIKSLGNSNWYITYILLSYLFTFIAFKICKKDLFSLIIITGFMFVYTMVLYFIDANDSHYYVTSFVFPLGMFYSRSRNKIEALLRKYWILLFCVFFFLYVILWFCWVKNSFSMIFYNGISVLFTLTFIVFTYKVSFRGKILYVLGKNVFQIYILQHLPMIIFKEMQYNDGGGYLLYFIICVVVTYVLTIFLNWIFKKIRVFNI